MLVIHGKTTPCSLTFATHLSGGTLPTIGTSFIREFKENSGNGFKWILTATNYFMRWVEAIPTKRAIDSTVKDFP